MGGAESQEALICKVRGLWACSGTSVGLTACWTSLVWHVTGNETTFVTHASSLLYGGDLTARRWQVHSERLLESPGVTAGARSVLAFAGPPAGSNSYRGVHIARAESVDLKHDVTHSTMGMYV